MSIGWTRKVFPYGKITFVNPEKEHAIFQASKMA
jgi:hypothetical protein